MRDVFARALDEGARLLQACHADASFLTSAAAACSSMVDVLRAGGTLFSCGNGGSLCDAAHFAEELSGRFRRDRRALAALAITDPAHLTCVANDYGFEHVFARFVAGVGRPGDALLLLSTSGNSANLILAAEAARSQDMKVIGLLGRGGGKLAALCDFVLVAPGETSDRIQEIHMLVLHAMVESIELELGLAGP